MEYSTAIKESVKTASTLPGCMSCHSLRLKGKKTCRVMNMSGSNFVTMIYVFAYICKNIKKSTKDDSSNCKKHYFRATDLE